MRNTFPSRRRTPHGAATRTPSGDTTTLTLTELPEGLSYKVIIRARYENASGPWTPEATQTIQAAEPVSSNPPAAPTGTADPDH